MTATFRAPGPLETAVLFLVFNRPDTTAQVFEAIRQAKPPRLYVAADGPREGRVGEVEIVARVREIATAVDWPCEVTTLFRNHNLGCKTAVSGAIDWFFDQEEQGIILEDDCRPSQSFFWYCQELLNRYKDDEQIFIVSGYNKQGTWRDASGDYFYSFFGGIWGWASWRRAWHHRDMEMLQLESLILKNAFVKQMGRKLGCLRQKQLKNAKRSIHAGIIDTWDYPWALTRHIHNGVACVPCKNLIQNIGFGENATHTKGACGEVAFVHELTFPLRRNDAHECDKTYDLLFVGHRDLRTRILGRFRRWAQKLKGE